MSKGLVLRVGRLKFGGGSGAGGSGLKGRRILGGEIDFRCSRVRDCVLGTEGVGNRGGQVDKFEIERSMD